MTGCCGAGGYERVFGERQARRDLRRYRRKGLPRDAADAVEFLAEHEVRTVLEVGGGIGAAEIELLRHGAERAVNVELSRGYEDAARTLAREEGLEDAIEWRVGDFVAEAERLERADAVLLNRVVCCYPDYEALLDAAAGRAQRLVAFTFPRSGRVASAVVAVANLALRLARTDFRAYAHPRAAMLAVAERHGFRLVHERRALVWQTVGLARS